MPQLAKNTSGNGVPERIGKYEIINEIGKGTTGDVFLSHDPYYGRDVAIKVYHIDATSDGQAAKIARKMFFNEAHIVASCSIRTSCLFTTPAKTTANTMWSWSTSRACVRWRRIVDLIICCLSMM